MSKEAARRRFARYLARAMSTPRPDGQPRYKNASELARALGSNPTVVLRWLNAETEISAGYIRDLAPLIDVNPLELFVQAGYFSRAEILESARRMIDADQRSDA